jgi:uncharacterized repeat protein (TIGR01451 family)
MVIIVIMAWFCHATSALAQKVSADFEIKRLSNIGGTWRTIALENTYSDAIIVCTHNLVSDANNSAVTRITNITASSFDLRLQQYENSASVTATDVHCVIADEGAYNSGGLKFEARKVLSDQTAGWAIGWENSRLENISASLTQSYTSPILMGQVMSFNDVRASVIFANDCEGRGNPPFLSGFSDGACVGKHIGQIDSTRLSETIGYVVIESGTVTVNDIRIAAAMGADTGAGVGNNPPFNYSVSGDFDIGVLTQAGEDGGQGGWAVLYGTDPLPSGQVRWAIDEETVAGDTSRTHTDENVSYWLFENSQAPDLSANKDVETFSGNTTDYNLPGSDVIYNISVANNGSGPVDVNSILIIDALPEELTFYNGDIDDGGPETDAVILTETGSGLTFNPATDLGFSNAASQPSDFTACNYTPAAGYDPDVTFICLAPKGALAEGAITPSSMTLSFRARIK